MIRDEKDKQEKKQQDEAHALERLTKSEAHDIKKQIDTGAREVSDVQDGDDNKHFIIDEAPTVLADGNLKMKNKVVATDPRMLPSQRFNKNKFRVVWQSVKFGRVEQIIHPPGKWVILPDDYYTPWIDFVGNKKDQGAPIQMQVRVGKDIKWNEK